MIAKWIIVGMLALGVVAAILAIGKPRRPLTPGDAALLTIFNTAYIVAIILWWQP